MGTKPSIFQPGYDGKHAAPDSTGRAVSHRSHNDAAHSGYDAPGNIARDSRVPKHTHDIQIHGGMVKQTKSEAAALGGNHASAIDALSGLTVVPGTPRTAPGWGDAGIQSGHPLANAPASKQTKSAPFVSGQRSRVGETYNGDPGQHHNAAMARGQDQNLHRQLGRAILNEALRAGSQDDCLALAGVPKEGLKRRGGR